MKHRSMLCVPLAFAIVLGAPPVNAVAQVGPSITIGRTVQTTPAARTPLISGNGLAPMAAMAAAPTPAPADNSSASNPGRPSLNPFKDNCVDSTTQQQQVSSNGQTNLQVAPNTPNTPDASTIKPCIV